MTNALSKETKQQIKLRAAVEISGVE